MTIAKSQLDTIGVRQYVPEVPFDLVNGPFPSFTPGEVAGGDAEAEFVYIYFNTVTAGVTLKQGDALVWDNSYQATQSLTSLVTRGQNMGTAFFGGRVADPASNGALGSGAPFSYTFPTAGMYGLWIQRAGTSLLNVTAGALTGNLAETTTTLSQIGAPNSPTVTSKLVTGVYLPPATFVFTANTVNLSNVLSAVSATRGLVVGQTVSGAGIATGAYITNINGAAVTLSLVCTATASGVTVTATPYSTYVTTTNLSPILTNVTTIYGIYPNQTITGTGIPGATTILSIQGLPGGYTITMSANATATANLINATTTGYVEAYIKCLTSTRRTNEIRAGAITPLLFSQENPLCLIMTISLAPVPQWLL